MNLRARTARLCLTWLACALLWGCGGSGGSTTTTAATLTDAELAQLQVLEQNVEQQLALVPGADAAEQFANIADWVRQQPGVSSVTALPRALLVHTAIGVTRAWYVLSAPQAQVWLPDEDTLPDPPARAFVGKPSKALLVRAVSDDLNMMRQAETSLTRIASLLALYGLETTVVDQPAATVELLKTFGNYGWVGWHGHGGPTDDGPCIAAGEIPTDDSRRRYADDLKNGRLIEGSVHVCLDNNCRWAGGGVERDVFAATPKFFRHYYRAGSLDHNVIFAMTCYGMADNRLGQAFVDLGAQGFSGWTDDTTMAAQAGFKVLSNMVSGRTLADAFSRSLEQGVTTDPRPAVNSRLAIFPSDSGAQLFTSSLEPAVTIAAPDEGATVSQSIARITGRVVSNRAIRNATITINGFVANLPLAGDGSFDRVIQARAGANKVTVAATSDGGTGQATVNFTQSGDPLPLWSELVWNKRGVDLDFHLLQAGAPESALGTAPQDAYYGNPTPPWGAILDFDNTSGFGPEHISMTSRPAPGVYRLYAHYYGGPEPTTAEAWIVTEHNTMRGGPRTLSAGQWWEIARINFPETGVETVRIIDEIKTTLGGALRRK